MKRFVLFFFVCSVWQLSSGQCLLNGDFSAMESCAGTGCGNSWTGNCNSWYTSHGTPNIVVIPPNQGGGKSPGYDYIYMWGSNSYGEGMYTPYSFQKNHTYDIKVNYVAFAQSSPPPSSPVTGDLDAYATNTLSPMLGCNNAESPPNPTPKQLIGIEPGLINQIYTFPPFTANDDYSQFWIYAQGHSGDAQSEEFQVHLYGIAICPSCTGNITYNSGVVPTGESAAGTIGVGSSLGSGGSGTVTINPGNSTTLTATNQINFGQSFQAIVTGSGTFVAQIVACNNSQNVSAYPLSTPDNLMAGLGKSIIMPGAGRNVDSAGVLPDRLSHIQVYPTVSKGSFTLTGSVSDLNNAIISVFDGSGNAVYHLQNGDNTTINLNLNPLASGLYFIQINNGITTTTQKIIIQK